MRGSTRRGRRAAVAAVLALLVPLIVATAPETAAVQARPAATTLTDSMDTCLRLAAADAGGVLVLTDARLSAYEAYRVGWRIRGGGRLACVFRQAGLTSGTAFDWWAGLPADRRPDVVVLAVPGTAEQITAWGAQLPRRRFLGTADSGVAPASVLPLWTRGVSGSTAGLAIISKLGERFVNAHEFTHAGALLHSSATQCAAAVASPRGVLVLGDSITYKDFAGIHTALKARGWVPCVFAQSSSRIAEHLSRVLAGKVPLPANVVVALGNNDLFTGNGYPYRFRIEAKRLLAALKGRNIVVPTVWRTKQQTFLPAMQHNCRAENAILRDLGRGRADMRTPDWASVIRSRPSLQYDGIHLTATGLRLRYDMFDAALESMQPPPAP